MAAVIRIELLAAVILAAVGFLQHEESKLAQAREVRKQSEHRFEAMKQYSAHADALAEDVANGRRSLIDAAGELSLARRPGVYDPVPYLRNVYGLEQADACLAAQLLKRVARNAMIEPDDVPEALLESLCREFTAAHGDLPPLVQHAIENPDE